MELYVLAHLEQYNILTASFKNDITCIHLNSENPDISSYSQLFSSRESKILAVEPSVINWFLPIAALTKIVNLKGICTSSAWSRFIDLDYCKDHHIAVTHSSGANSQSVAEYAIWMMFCLSRQLPLQIQNQFGPECKNKFHTELAGKTMGVIGYGNIGSRVANLGKGLGMNIVYWNRSIKHTSYVSVSLEDLISTSDVVINCLEICPETQGLLHSSLLSKMKPTSYFVSVLGGMGWGVQDDAFLLEMVAKNKIAGFAVENEHSGKWNSFYDGNVFIPSASAHHTKESEERVNKQWADGIASVLNNTQSDLRLC